MTRQNPYWTNPSVTGLARSDDPIRAIEAKAREAVLAAAQEGWEGPPFDPFKLAELLKITVVPSYDVLDARTVPVGASSLQIEFNPNRPLGRIRFSVAHEISHTFFPDCSETVRNRALTGELRDDEWQLELLCNIGAAELLMPTDLGDLEHEPVNIENILRLRKEYDVSAEALFLRIVKLTDRPCAMFAAARPRGSEDRPAYRIDYSMPSRTWPIHVPQGLEVRDQTIIAGCTAVGYTAKGQEQWHPSLPSFMVECVGIPPYPEHRFPRVVGVLFAEDGLKKEAPQIINLIGDATEPRGSGTRIIAHVVNDRTPRWGGGFALAVRKKWRFVQDDFIQWVELNKENLTLGNIHLTPVSENLSIVHMIAQHGYGPSTKPRVRYTALRECLSKLASIAADQGASVHMPRIGAGQAGGNWGLIRNLIDEELALEGIRVAVYDLPEYVPAEVQGVMNL